MDGETGAREQNARRPSWWHFAGLVVASGASAFFGALYVISAAFCEAEDCTGASVFGWILLACWAVLVVFGWWMVGRIIKYDQRESFADDATPSLKWIAAATALFLPWLIVSVNRALDAHSLNGAKTEFVAIGVFAAIVVTRLGYWMYADVVRRSVIPYVVIAVPILALLTVYSGNVREFGKEQHAQKRAEQRELELAKNSAFEVARSDLKVVLSIGSKVARLQIKTAKSKGKLANYDDIRRVQQSIERKTGTSAVSSANLRYAISDDEMHAATALRHSGSEFVWTFDIDSNDEVSVSTFCHGPSTCGGMYVPIGSAFAKRQGRRTECMPTRLGRGNWCASVHSSKPNIVKSPPAAARSILADAQSMPWLGPGLDRINYNGGDGIPEGRVAYSWINEFSRSLSFRQSAEMTEHLRYANFHVGWRLDELVNKQAVLPLSVKLSYKIFSRNKRAILVLKYRGSTFVWDYYSPKYEDWEVTEYCTGWPICGTIAPAQHGFQSIGFKPTNCLALKQQPHLWCNSENIIRGPHVERLPRGVRWRISRAKPISDAHRRPPDKTELDASIPGNRGRLKHAWVEWLTDKIIWAQRWYVGRGYPYLDYSKASSRSKLEADSSWQGLPKDVRISGNVSKDGKRASVSVRYGDSLYLLDFVSYKPGRDGYQVYCRGTPLCGMAAPDYYGFRTLSQRDRKCRELGRDMSLWCTYDFRRHRITAFKPSQLFRSRHRRLMLD